MKIRVNGEARSFEGPLTVAGLIKALGMNPRTVVVEKNLVIVARDDLEGTRVDEGDTFEIVRLVGGG